MSRVGGAIKYKEEKQLRDLSYSVSVLSGQGQFEDIRRRQTYWLMDEDIMRIDELSKETGVKKYDVVAGGVLLLHEYVFGKEDASE